MARPKKVVERKPLLSIVVPLHNGAKYILALLESIDKQTVKIDSEVIIQDDYSTDNSIELIKNSSYMNTLNIKFYKNLKRKIHCPGNTRLDGMSHVTGTWVTFIDQDDRFELNAFEEVFKCIEFNKEQNFLISDFREYDPVSGKFIKIFNNMDVTWMHGKFYNVKFLKDNNINFRLDLNSDEDLFFNQTVFAVTTINKYKYSILKVFTYIWTYNIESEGRRNEDGRVYIDRNYRNYFIAGMDPWLEQYKLHPEYKANIFGRLCYILLYGYYYYQSLYYRNGFKHIRENRDIFEDNLNKVLTTFNATKEDIINIVYKDSSSFNRVRTDVLTKSNLPIMEVDSFKTFIEKF